MYRRKVLVVFMLLTLETATAEEPKWAAACQSAWDDGNATTAFQYCSKAADEGHSKSQYLLGNIYFEGIGIAKDTKKAAALWMKAAQAGVADAQHNLGRLYQKGIEVDQSFSKAMEWYQKAAAQGDTYSMHNIGFFYQKGQGVPVDFKKAEEWYERAASKGLANSQYNLAVMYYNGEELPKDKVRAYAWIYLASEADFTPARNDRPVLEQSLTQAERQAGIALAGKLVKK